MNTKRMLDFLFTPWVSLLFLFLAYPTVIVVEWGITRGLDLYLRKAGIVPQAYYARLPDHIVNRPTYAYRLCERNRVALLWEYRVCLDAAGKMSGCEAEPVYSVVYWAPTLNSIPWWKDYYFGMPFYENLLVIDENKQVCVARSSNR